MNIFYDTEFIDDGKTIDLISIGMVSSLGELYYESTEFDLAKAKSNPWLVENVLANLEGGAKSVSRQVMRNEVLNFIGSHFAPELWAWFSAYDHVVLAQLFGRMLDLPPAVPMYTNDLVTLMRLAGVSRSSLPEQDESSHHNALADAKWNKEIYNFIETRLNWK